MKDDKKQYNWNELPGTVVFTQPDSFKLKGMEYGAKYWVDAIDDLCFALKEMDKEKMEEFLKDEKHRTTRIAYLAKTSQEIHFQKYLKKSDLWLNQKIDAPRSIKLIRKLLEKYGIGQDQFQLYLRPADRLV